MVSLAEAAFPLLPAGPEGVVWDAGPGWVLPRPQLKDPRTVIWGRPPLPFGTDVVAAARAAAAREVALARIVRKPPDGVADVRIHRWPPPRFDHRSPRSTVRAGIFQGALVELRPPHAPESRLEVIARAAGVEIRSFRPTSTGAALALGWLGGSECVLRVGRAAGPGDPAVAADALVALADMQLVPRLLNRGVSADASWTVESRLPGRRPGSATQPLLHDVIDLCARLPLSDEDPAALDDDLAVVARALPTRQTDLERLRQGWRPHLDGLPAILRHGDLWVGNLLTARSRLTGVVDWDHWHPRGVPGTDLLHLMALEEAARGRSGLGDVYAGFRHGTSRAEIDRLLGRVGIEPAPDRSEGIIGAWWASAVAGTLGRLPHLALDEAWIGSNVDPVLGREAG